MALKELAGGLYNKILNIITSATTELPKLRYHVANCVVNFHDNFVLSVVKLDGVVYESIPDVLLENDYDVLTRVFTDVAREYAGRVSFHTYQIRRKINQDVVYQFDNKFCQDFATKYLKRFNDTDYYQNNFYIAITLKFNESIDEGIADIESIVNSFVMKLQKYEPRILVAYKNEQGVLCSEVLEFFYELLNSEKPLGCCPLTGSPAYQTLPSSNLHFGYEVMQSKGFLKDRFICMLDAKDFPATTKQGMYDIATLSLPFEYNLIHSFTAFEPTKSQSRIRDQLNRLRSTDDKAEHQQLELEEAQGYVQSGELAIGEYHSAMLVFGDNPKQAIENMTYASANLSNNAGAIYRKATLSMPATFFSQFPKFPRKPRKLVKSTRNLAGVFSMHNYSRGKSWGNPIGDGSAVMPLETVSKTLYDFNFHFTNPLEDTIGDQVAGHTLILGATGTGKTTLQSAMTAFMQRFNPAMFVLDKDNGMEIFIRALNGDYFGIAEGVPTGINPFQFEDTPRLREFLNSLVVTCATDKDIACTSEEQNQIKHAIDAIMELPIHERRFNVILQAIHDGGGNTLYQRLLKWCYDEINGIHGRFAWVLDNPTNKFDPSSFKIVGFDVGDILKEDYQPTEPLLACLLYMKDIMGKKYPLMMTVVEEFWLPLKYKTPREMMLDVLKTGRKRGEFMLLVTQSPEEAVQSEIFPAIVQQTPTKILLPNPDAEYKNEQGGGYSRIGLTEKEFKKLQGLALDSRTFLIKQGHQSSFGMLDLYGFSDEIAVLSGSKGNVEILHKILELLPDNTAQSENWLPIFFSVIKDKKKGLDMSTLIRNIKTQKGVYLCN